MSTDPSSSDFDPLSALYSGTNETPGEGVKIYDNIAMFEGSLKKKELGISEQPGPSKKAPKSFSQKRKVREEAQNRDVTKLKEFMEIRKKMDVKDDPEADEKKKIKESETSRQPKPKKTLLTSMESLSKGPYSIVHEIVKKHFRCNVYVRDFCGLRGVCSGYVVAYDRFLNLAMIDVDETFRKPPLGKVADHQKSLSISVLEEAVRNLSLGKSQVKVDPKKSRYGHRSTTGVQVMPKKKCVKEDPKSSGLTCSDPKVKVVGTQYFKSEVFHGGTPQLYHRHMDQLLIRGDSIVLVSVKK